MERKRLIKISKNRIFLTPEYSLGLSQTNLNGDHLSFRNFEDIYFEIEILNYDKVSQAILIEITDYQPENIQSFQDQKAKAKVLFINFKPLRWQHLERHLSSYTKSILLKKNIIFDDTSSSVEEPNEKTLLRLSRSIEGKNIISSKKLYPDYYQNELETEQREPCLEKITEKAKIYFKEVEFSLGFVSFLYKSKILNETYNLKIENHHLLPEFNAIKSYFPRVFGGQQKFSIIINFILTDKLVTDIITNSPEIESIDENIIKAIKRDQVLNLTSTPLRKSVDKSLFTSEDIFDSFEDKLENGNIFKQSGEDILNSLIKIKNIRNEKHLQFLSGTKHSVKQKLRFTLKPLFGFVFFIEGETKNHYCWELLNSHATYLWSFQKSESDVIYQFKRVNQTINIIRDIGRGAYKTNYKNNKVDSDLSFCTIEHIDINSTFKDGFAEWQHRLNERLV